MCNLNNEKDEKLKNEMEFEKLGLNAADTMCIFSRMILELLFFKKNNKKSRNYEKQNRSRINKKYIAYYNKVTFISNKKRHRKHNKF